MRLALIGNCNYQALVDERASIQWLCWPRFDSSFVFGPMLDAEKGGEFSVTPAAHFESAQSYRRHTNIVDTRFVSDGADFVVTDFAPRFAQYDRFFKPTMLIRRVRPISGNSFVRIVCRPVYDYGKLQLDPYTASNHIGWVAPGAQMRLTTNAPLTHISEGRPFALDRDIYLVLTWGQPLQASLVETCETFLRRTERYWRTWVKHANIPNRFQDEVIRSALTLKLHQYEDTGAITAATTTSVPEYPGSGRCWDYRYCWPRDTYFTVAALRRLGHFEEMERFVGYLVNLAHKGGPMQPVYGIGGETRLPEETLDHLRGFGGEGPVRIGNGAYQQEQHDIYGELLSSMAPLFLDVRYRDNMGPWAKELLGNLLAEVERTLELPDVGLWEKRDKPRVHTFSLLMHWHGAVVTREVGRLLGHTDLEARAQTIELRSRQLIEGKCWRESLGYYADTIDTDFADGALMQMINSGYLDNQPDRARRHLDGLVKQLAAKEHLLFRYRQDDGLGATHATFTVCGLWYAEALARLGDYEAGERVLRNLLQHANHVDLLSEDIDPKTGQLWGNFPQTYSHVGVINAAFALSANNRFS